MLLRYIASNYKSIGHSVEFTMFPIAGLQDDRFLTKIETKMGQWKILRRGCFFGPNASGKSTFIESIDFSVEYILNSKKSGKTTGINQFKGNFKDLEEISTFQFMFYIDEEVYEYGFSIDRRQVHEEWLMILTDKNLVPMFTRSTDEKGKTTIEIESKLAYKNSKDRNLAEILKNSMKENQKNQLFLYKLYDNGIKKVEKIIEWFESINIIFPSTKLQGLPLRVKEDDEFRKFLSDTLSKLDTGIFDISVSSDKINFKDLAEKMDIPDQIIDDIEEIKNGIVNLNGKYFIFTENKNEMIFVQLKFEHKLNRNTVKFNIEDESDGTQRLLDLLPILFNQNSKKNSIYIVDELDRSLHTKLSKYFLKEFIEGSEDLLKQVIFTGHDINLIDLEEFRREEIWFIEKNMLGETELKPFSDFEIEEGQNTVKDYLNGRFGAVPMIGGID